MKRLEAFVDQIFTDCLLCTRCWEHSHEHDGKYPCSHGAQEEHTQNRCLPEVDKGSEVRVKALRMMGDKGLLKRQSGEASRRR